MLPPIFPEPSTCTSVPVGLYTKIIPPAAPANTCPCANGCGGTLKTAVVVTPTTGNVWHVFVPNVPQNPSQPANVEFGAVLGVAVSVTAPVGGKLAVHVPEAT